MTSIIFECSGGMLDRSMDLTLKLDDLPGRETRELIELIRDANFFNLPSNLIKNPDPEEIQYTITVDAGAVFHTVRTHENATPPSLRPLLKELSMRMETSPVDQVSK